MNTPSHLVLNLCVLGRREPANAAIPIAVGAVLPDVPMFLFYAVEKLWLGVPERVIWATDYFAPAWQDFFDVFNSIPIIAAGLGISLLSRRSGPRLLFASMMLHTFFDLPLHHEDAHRHFYPLTDWRFASPVSYWNPAHYGWIAGPIEVLMALGGCVLLARRYPTRAARITLALVASVYAAFITFALVMWE